MAIVIIKDGKRGKKEPALKRKIMNLVMKKLHDRMFVNRVPTFHTSLKGEAVISSGQCGRENWSVGGGGLTDENYFLYIFPSYLLNTDTFNVPPKNQFGTLTVLRSNFNHP